MLDTLKFAEATREDLATKQDLAVRAAELRGEMTGLRADMDKLHWRTVATVAGMLLVNLAGVYVILWPAIARSDNPCPEAT